MGRKDFLPTSNSNNANFNRETTDNFGSGTIKDMPASEIPQSALADAVNVNIFPTEVQGRLGTQQFTTQEIQPIPGRSGLSGSKTGFIITSDQNQFTIDDVGNYWVWPGDDTVHEEITRYISGTTVETMVSSTVPWTAGCYVRGKKNVWSFHTQAKKWLFQWGTDFWVANLELTEFTLVTILSRDKPHNSISTAREFDENSWFVWNSYGIFRIDLLNTSEYIAYKININNPADTIVDETEDENSAYRYNYIYSAARLTGSERFRDRLTPVRIEAETGTNQWDDALKDYGDIYTQEPTGPGTDTYGLLTCNPIIAGYRSALNWQSISDGTFNIDINGLGITEIVCDFSDVVTMVDVASTIQSSLQAFFPGATCVYKTNNLDQGYFELSSGRVAFGTMTQATEGLNGTDISTIMQARSGQSVLSTPGIDTPNVIGPLYVPTVRNIPDTEYEWHLTHFPIYRTLDIINTYKLGTRNNAFNDPEQFVWAFDLRIGGAMYGRRFNGHILLFRGQFEEADVGSTVEWEDGSRDTILEYVAPDDVIINTSEGYKEESILMALHIGNGRVARASQSETTVTRTHGTEFTQADVGKSLWWSDGYISHIVSVTDANTVEVNDSNVRPVQGAATDFSYRYFNDTVSDTTLRTRLTSLLVRNRFFEPMSNANVGAISPGFMLSAVRGKGQLEYCTLNDSFEYLAGHHSRAYQISNTIKDDIQALLVIPTKFIAVCSNQTWHGFTNTNEFITLPKTQVVISLITGIDVLDGGIGIWNWGSIREVEDGMFQFLTNEKGNIGWRKFDGYKYGPDELLIPGLEQKTFSKNLSSLQRAFASIYDGIMGLIVWGRE